MTLSYDSVMEAIRTPEVAPLDRSGNGSIWAVSNRNGLNMVWEGRGSENAPSARRKKRGGEQDRGPGLGASIMISKLNGKFSRINKLIVSIQQ